MIELFLPREANNRYRGHRAALWLFGLFIGLRLLMSINSIFNTGDVASGADGFALDVYGQDGARAVLLLFALDATGKIGLTAAGLISLVRYKALIPLFALMMLGETVFRRIIIASNPIARTDANPIGWYVSLSLMGLLVAILVLSAIHPNSSIEQASDD